MDTLTTIASRHSSREFTNKPIPREMVEQMVDAGLRAPTARNEQPWEFVVATDPIMRRQIADLADHGKFIAQAPVCIAVFCRDTKYYLEDGCAAVENILLAATALGVQSCWVAGDKKGYCQKVADLLGLPPGHKLIALVAVGYAAIPGRSPSRPPLNKVLHWERF